MENRDADRTLALLWRKTLGTPQGTRGPKQRTSVDEVIKATELRSKIIAAIEAGLGRA